jgi:hypothetical protein
MEYIFLLLVIVDFLCYINKEVDYTSLKVTR